MGTVSISHGNSKMGDIASVSLPAIKTCRECACNKKCYAAKLERFRPSVKNAYQHNLDLLEQNPEVYWREVQGAIMMSRFFRFHVSGDIPDESYLWHMHQIAKHNQHCNILCFTKKYEIVNKFYDEFEKPNNLHIIFSGWQGLPMDNPHNFPEAHVLYKNGTTTARVDAIKCGGNCTKCAMAGAGCWVLKDGEQVVFPEH